MQTITQHHKVFHEFVPFSRPAEKGYDVDFLGCKIRHEFWPATLRTGISQTSYPPLDEEYFEWIDLLESVVSAKRSYTMIELGAGFGRWLVRAAQALRQYNGLPFHLVAVEAEPLHFQWLLLHFRDNNIDPSEHRLIHAAVTDHSGETLFYVGKRKVNAEAAAEWYGQSIATPKEVIKDENYGEYCGFRLIKLRRGWESIRVACVTLSEILRDLKFVDLIDLDVQGEELKVISAAIEGTTQKVKRLHIETHSRETEVGLRELMSKFRWECTADYPCGSTSQTPWGPIRFTGGVQSWLNPRVGSWREVGTRE